MMKIQTAVSRLHRAARRFAIDRRANVAIIFAIAIIPILAFVGFAIDYSRANAMKSDMQAALDSTALMASKNAASLGTDQIQSKAQEFFLALFNDPVAKDVHFTAEYSTTEGSQLSVKATADIETEFLGIIGFDKLTVSGASLSKWGSTRLRVSLVLDTTGSMSSDGKIDALKTATKNLLAQLQNAVSTAGDVYVSIIPFSKNVNLDPGNYNGNWINWTDWELEPAILKNAKPSNWDQIGPGSSCPFSTGSHGFRCTNGPDNDASNTNTIPASGSWAGYICPGVDGGNKDSTKVGLYYNGCYDSGATTATTTTPVCSGKRCSCSGNNSTCSCTGKGKNTVCMQTTTVTGPPYTHKWIANDHDSWNGCVADRGSSSGPVSDYDRLVTEPSNSIDASKFPAEQSSYCSLAVAGLNDNWSAMKAQVDNLYPLGATNQPIGLVWGWQSLVGGGPLSTPAKNSNYAYSDVIILT